MVIIGKNECVNISPKKTKLIFLPMVSLAQLESEWIIPYLSIFFFSILMYKYGHPKFSNFRKRRTLSSPRPCSPASRSRRRTLSLLSGARFVNVPASGVEWFPLVSLLPLCGWYLFTYFHGCLYRISIPPSTPIRWRSCSLWYRWSFCLLFSH